MRTIAYLALGSNLGDRAAQLSEALKFLNSHLGIKIEKISSIYETEPWPKLEFKSSHSSQEEKKNWHLNQVIEISTDLSPEALLLETQEIEKKMGRTEKNSGAPREIDIDILLYDQQVIDLPTLSIPHKYMNERQFVLVPLLEIAPELKDPRTGKGFQEFLDDIVQVHAVLPYF